MTSLAKKRIGILGGSYNPPHKGHLFAAEEAHTYLGLDEVWMWVSYNIFKDLANYAPLHHRTRMTEILAEGRDWLKVQDMEKDFHDTMTATTMTMLQAMYPRANFVWVFGDDNFSTFHTWNREKFEVNGKVVPDWQYLMHNFSIGILHRPGYRMAARKGEAARIGRAYQMNEPKDLARDKPGWAFIPNHGLVESSTHIKQELIAGKRGIKNLPPKLEDYIYDNGLLKTRADFNGASMADHPPNNPVRFETFITLAHAANLVKSMGGDASYIAYAEKCYDAAKGSDEAARLFDLSVACASAGTSGSLRGVIGALARLCAAEGMEKHRMANILTIILNDPDRDEPAAARERTQKCLTQYAKVFAVSAPSAPAMNGGPS